LACFSGPPSALAAMAALTAVWRINGATPLSPDRGALAVLSKFDPGSNQVAVTLSPVARLSPAALPSRLTLADTQPAAVPSGEPLIRLSGLAAAVYDIEATIAAPTTGHIFVTIDPTFGPLWTWDLAGGQGAVRHTIALPVPIGPAIVDVEPHARSAIARLIVKPASGIPSSERPFTERPLHVTRYGPAIVFLMDGDGFMEAPGAWIAGGSSATFVMMREQPVPLRLFVRTPPVGNQVLLEGDGWRQQLILKPGEERLVDLPVDPHRLAATLRVSASAGARPIDFERGSTDSRFLGCWIEVR
jgi:hypothetical protein